MIRAALIGAALALAACGSPSWQPGPACGHSGVLCATHSDCCSFACINDACECAPAGQHCLADIACCAGNKCVDEVCLPGCRFDGSTCETATDCCDGDCVGGLCSSASCGGSFEACTDSNDCCPNLGCDNNRCTTSCGQRSYVCGGGANEPCCSGLTCIDGTCGGPLCKAFASTCNSPSECCGAGCVDGACCSEEGNSCSGSSLTEQCCPGLRCNTSTFKCEACAPPSGGAACTEQWECCAPSSCNLGAMTCCAATGYACSAGPQCCTGRCKSSTGMCCAGTNQECETSVDCCSGATCNPLNHYCECVPYQGTCDSSIDCCAGTCNNGKCCNTSTSFCLSGTECCSGVCKPNNSCM